VSTLDHLQAPAPSLGRPVTGPAALAGGVRRFLVLTWTMAVLEFRLRFFGSVLGYLWQLMRPLLLFTVIYLVFTQAFKLATDVAFYPVTLLMGIVLYSFFADATGGAVSSVLDRENIVRKIHFPRLAIPTSVVLTAFFNLLLNLIAVGVFLIATGVRPHWTWLELPLLLGYLVVFALGIAMLVSAWFVRYRDVRPIWDVLLQITFYASPVLWVTEKLGRPHLESLLLHLNPLAPLLQQVRHAVIDPDVKSAAAVMGGWWHVLVPISIVAAIFALGLWVFRREAPRIAEDL
jgi:ABC-2 type transport system permease protein